MWVARAPLICETRFHTFAHPSSVVAYTFDQKGDLLPLYAYESSNPIVGYLGALGAAAP